MRNCGQLARHCLESNEDREAAATWTVLVQTQGEVLVDPPSTLSAAAFKRELATLLVDRADNKYVCRSSTPVFDLSNQSRAAGSSLPCRHRSEPVQRRRDVVFLSAFAQRRPREVWKVSNEASSQSQGSRKVVRRFHGAVKWVVENPVGSYFWELDCATELANFAGAVDVDVAACNFGSSGQKRLRIARGSNI